MNIAERIYKKYVRRGLLVRANDGQHPITFEELKDTIGKIALSETDIVGDSDKVLNFGGLLPNNAPTYSATLLSNHKYPVLWYYYKFSDPFNSSSLPNLGERTTLVAILKTSKIFVHGLCLWDADSNDRNSGQIPNNRLANKSTFDNDFTSRKIFDGIGNYKFENTKSLNNFSWYNPLLRPCTKDSIATTKKEIRPFLSKAGELKEYWVSHLKSEAGGFNEKWADYINVTYGSGVETEVLVTPKFEGKSIFGKLKFSIDDIEAMAFITDGLEHGTRSITDYKKAVEAFFKVDPGWTHSSAKARVNCLPVISVINVALPNVDIDSTTVTDVGNAWTSYLNKGKTYQRPLSFEDFKLIKTQN